MKCLVCKNNDLKQCEIESGLKVHNCQECGGNWLRFGDYIKWHNNDVQANDNNPRHNFPVNDSTNPKLCPDCGRILAVFKVANNLKFSIEHCLSCGGIWLDKNEWENLRENNLHNQIEKFFTDSWQKRLMDEERKEFLDSFYCAKFGTEDYERIKQVREWLNSNANRSMLMAFLTNEDPYKI